MSQSPLVAPLRIRAPWLHPTRWPVIGGTIVVFVAAWLPWQSQQLPLPGPPQVITGMNTWDAPGAQLMAITGVCLIFSLSRGIAGTSVEPLQWLPLVFGVAALFIALESYQALAPNSANPSQATTVAIGLGLILTVAASATVAFGGGLVTWICVRDGRRRRAALRRDAPRQPVDPLARYQRPRD